MTIVRLLFPALSILLGATACLGQVAPRIPASTNPTTASGIKTLSPALRSNMLMRTGGVCVAPASGPCILLLDTQHRVPEAALQDVAGEISKIMRLPCRVGNGTEKDPVAAATTALSDKSTAAVIVLCDSATQPSLLVAPEARWAIVNTKALDGLMVPADKLALRTQKEVWRALGYVMGAANSNYEHCLLKPVFSLADLDDLAAKTLSPEPLGKIMAQAQKMEIKTIRISTYRKAVEEGWAPAPTNAFQQAVWQELKGKSK